MDSARHVLNNSIPQERREGTFFRNQCLRDIKVLEKDAQIILGLINQVDEQMRACQGRGQQPFAHHLEKELQDLQHDHQNMRSHIQELWRQYEDMEKN